MAYLSPVAGIGNIFLPLPEHPDYEISIDGTAIRDRRTGTAIPFWPSGGRRGRRYLECRLGAVHRLMASAQLGRPLIDGEQARHLDDDPLNNSHANIAVGSERDNRLDRLTNDAWGYKLRISDVREIRRLAGEISTKALAEQFGVSRWTIRRIVTGRAWAVLS